MGQGDRGFGKQHKMFQIRFYFNATFTWSKLNATTFPLLCGIGNTLTSFQESFFLNAFVMTKQGCNEFKLNSLKLITLSYSTSLPQENSEMSCLQVSEYKDHTVQNANTFLIVCFYKYFMQKY